MVQCSLVRVSDLPYYLIFEPLSVPPLTASSLKIAKEN